MKTLDFRSDTVTTPTDRMREAMAYAIVGDDVYGDDPTVNRLEAMGAEMLGKEAALFVPSGTFSNQCAIMTHTNPSDEIVVLEDCHILIHECGAPAKLSGVNMRIASSHMGEYDIEELKKLIRTEDIHYPKTSLICLENAHSNGRAIDLPHMRKVREVSLEYNIPIHLDGARIFNAAQALGVDPKEMTELVDSVSVCLSKGLGAPVGSLLLGSKDFIEKARRNRKLMGGGMRQAGILAAAGIVALEEMVQRLEEDHTHANYLAISIDQDNVEIFWDRLDINMVFLKLLLPIDLKAELEKENILINDAEYGEYRIALHKDITRENVDHMIKVINRIIANYKVEKETIK